MEKILNVGFIGCGGHAWSYNIPSVAENPNLKVHTFCDLNEDVLKRALHTYPGTRSTKNFEELFSNPEIDMVVCSTKPSFRIPVIEATVRHKKPLFIEKPIAFTYEDTLKIVRLLSSSDIPFLVGYNRPYSPMMKAVSTIYHRHQKGNVLLSYRIIGEAAIWPADHRKAVCEGKESTVIHEITHIFHLLTWLTGFLPRSVYMAGGGHMDNVITLRYTDEVTATIVAGDNGCRGYPKERLEINTNGMTMVSESFVELLVAGAGEDSGVKSFEYLYNNEKRNDGFIPFRDLSIQWREHLTAEEMAVGRYDKQIPIEDKGHYGKFEWFRRHILSGDNSKRDILLGAISNVIAHAAIQSWEQNQVIQPDYSEILDLLNIHKSPLLP